ncbi:hypothetical protein FEAC_03910 [Ferrimicrobium acidiphilum DSM 19497]|jgi:hypothetical protein|uniref:Uncharacterized protein n=1 Tax=Ferrimicrobium acidiphilum DSM 19497 TaxID=1121877 RepID=A0A0D8FWH2_9ACTN|nr:hypothetical protein FEAC_03910 [Ferrimicrobium acidiphilum DSM 19497]
MRQALITKGFTFWEPYRCKGRGTQGDTRLVGNTATLRGCWVLLQVHRVKTCLDLVGPVGFEPRTKVYQVFTKCPSW